MIITKQQVKQILHIDDSKLENLIKEERIKPINNRKPDSKKFFARFESKDIDKLKKEFKEEFKNGNVIQYRVKKIGTVPNQFMNRLERIEVKLDTLLKIWS